MVGAVEGDGAAHRARGALRAQGVPEPITLFRLVQASGGGRRAQGSVISLHWGRPLRKIVMLMRRWERARQGDGQLVLIIGEPGLGKSA